LFGALCLEGGGRAEGRVEGYIVSLAVGGAGLDVTTAFPFGVGA
jgi:hypothetical protein